MNLALPAPLFAAVSTWLTPPWLIGVGAAIGLAVLAICYGIALLVSRKAATFLHDSLREGFLMPVLVLAAIMAVGAAAASPAVNAGDLVRSLIRLPSAGQLDFATTIPGNASVKIDLDVRPAELKTLEIKSDQDLTL